MVMVFSDPLIPIYADAEVVGMVADPFQVTQRLDENHVGFRGANSCFQAVDVFLAGFQVEAVKLVFQTTSLLRHRPVESVKGF